MARPARAPEHPCPLTNEVKTLNITLLMCGSLALLLAVAALVREVRLRRALQALLARILARWREYVLHKRSSREDADAAGDDRRQRLR